MISAPEAVGPFVGRGSHHPAVPVGTRTAEDAPVAHAQGTHRGLEARLVPQRGIEIEWISIAGVRGKGALAWISAPFRVAGAVLEALRALRRRKPRAVLGMGGFVAGPGGELGQALVGVGFIFAKDFNITGVK